MYFDKIIVWVLVFKLNDGLEAAAGAPKLSSKYLALVLLCKHTALWANIIFLFNNYGKFVSVIVILSHFKV